MSGTPRPAVTDPSRHCTSPCTIDWGWTTTPSRSAACCAWIGAAAGHPRRCREMVATMKDRGLWSSDAPTPHQTLASALLREVTKKGPASRFRKADRGRFELNGN